MTTSTSKRILTINSKQMLTGTTPFKNNTTFGLWNSVPGYNPGISGGGLSISKAAVNISGTVMADNFIQSFVSSQGSLYAYGNNGGFYKISNLTASTPTISNVRTGTAIANALAWGLESFQTKVGPEYLYYFTLNTVGQFNLTTNTFNDALYSLSDGAGIQHPTCKVYDQLFFGAGNFVSELYDDQINSNAAKNEGIYTLPYGQNVYGLTYDGQYLAVAANTGNPAKMETTIYFFDTTTGVTTPTKSWVIRDSLVTTYIKDDTTYALCINALWQFTFLNPPQQVRDDVVGIFGFPNVIDQSAGALLIGQNQNISSLGKLSPEFPNATFVPASGISGIVTALSAKVSPTRLFVGDTQSGIYYIDWFSQKTANGDIQMTGYIDLGDYYSIDQIDLIFQDILQSGDSAQVRVRVSDTGNEGIAYADYTAVSFANNSSLRSVSSGKSMSVKSSGNIQGDKISLEITLSGVCVIKQIEIYGSTKQRS